MSSRSLFVAALQTAGIPGDPGGTLEQFERHVRALRSTFDGLQLVVTPELHLMALTSLVNADGLPTEEELAVDIPGGLTERLGALARETELWLIPGSVFERVNGGVANTALVLSPAGELVASYRKCFPWQPYETSQPGTRTVCFDIDGIGRFGLAICHDGAFPEIFRSLAWQGAEAIFQLVLTETSDREAETVIARASAIVNQVAVVNVNTAAPVGNGRSLVIDPEGAVRYEAGVGEEVVTAVLDLDQVERVREPGSVGINRLWEEMDRVGTLAEQAADGDPVHPELLARAEVREQEDADGVVSGAPARGADPALPVEAAHPRARTDCALLEVGRRLRDRAADVARLHVGHPRVREPAVIALADDRDHDVVDPDARIALHRHRDGAVVDPADRVGRREVDRRLEYPPLPDLERPGQLAGAVEHGRSSRDGKRRRDDCRHAGPLDGHVTDRDPDVGDRVPGPGLERADDDAVLARP